MDTATTVLSGRDMMEVMCAEAMKGPCFLVVQTEEGGLRPALTTCPEATIRDLVELGQDIAVRFLDEDIGSPGQDQSTIKAGQVQEFSSDPQVIAGLLEAPQT